MSSTVQAVRGMNDILPEQTPQWQYLESGFRALMAQYGYREIRLPVVEKTELFHRSIGEVTDVVEKEMYTFEDRNGDSLSLRPEGTAGCVRACIENGLLHNQVQRLWYAGQMFRHERPQKGRYRQFHQVGVEAYGLAGPDIDAELIVMTRRWLDALGLGAAVTLQLNSLGTAAARAAYRERLVAYLAQHADVLDEDSQRRLHTNPLRILDSKNPAMAPMLAEAPVLTEHLDAESQAHFEALQGYLRDAGVDFLVNPRLVRGLDYYSRTVFEWVTDRLGAQGTVCAGGRYDDLVEQLGGKPTPAIGFAAGLERLVALLDETRRVDDAPHVYLVMAGEVAERRGFALAEGLRDALPGLRVLMHAGGGSFKSQLKRADRSGAAVAVILGESEVAQGVAGIKWLREAREQESVAQERLAEYLADRVTRPTTQHEPAFG